MKQLYLLNIDTGNAAVPDELCALLPADKRERALRHRNGLDRKTALYSALLLRALLARHTGIRADMLDIGADLNGKPRLLGCASIEFNISNTRYAVAAALSDKPVGVDVERVRDMDISFAPAVLSDTELTLLQQDTPEQRISKFIELWTRKEARLKRRGTGLFGSLKACDATAEVPGEALFTVHSGGYIVSVCAGEAFNAEDLVILAEEDLAAMLRSCAC